MKSHTKLSILSAILILTVWCLPVLAEIMPENCCCELMIQCKCECDKNKETDNGPNEIYHLGNSECACSVSANSNTNESVLVIISKSIKNPNASFAINCFKEQNFSKEKTETVFSANRFHFQPLFLLNASFLL